MKEIGGYFELELNRRGKEYHSKAIRLNSGRHCLEHVLRLKKYSKLFIPKYICDVIYEPLKRTEIPYENYALNENLEPVLSTKLESGDALLYVNYFGLFSHKIKKLNDTYKNLIIDNSQAFFNYPPSGIDTFYSPRKFFGVPDGGYLYTTSIFEDKFGQDESYQRMKHLLKRIDKGAGFGYKDFKENSLHIARQPICKMSKLTQAILKGIHYSKIIKQRNLNFLYLHEHLNKINRLSINTDKLNGPMVYPLWLTSNELRNKLINQRIYIPIYWPNVLQCTSKNSIEYDLAENLLSLPIDQRYNIKDMKYLIETLKNYI